MDRIFKVLNFQTIASGSSGNCYQLSNSEDRLLIECGISWKRIQKALNFKTSGLSGCLVSHFHADHSKAIKDVASAGIDIYASEDVFEHFSVKNHRTHTSASMNQFSIGKWRILPFDLVHDVPNLGFLISTGTNKFLYATDTSYIKYQFVGLTHIAIEANFQQDILKQNVKDGIIPSIIKRRVNKNHFSLERVLEFLKATDLSKVEKIYLLHISKNNADPAEMKRAVQALTGKEVAV